jgi:hypothetical protein
MQAFGAYQAGTEMQAGRAQQAMSHAGRPDQAGRQTGQRRQARIKAM